MTRPQIDDDLHAEVVGIYESIKGREPERFEDALRLLLELADVELSEASEEPQGWYPGKYAGEVLDKLAERRLARGAGGKRFGRRTEEKPTGEMTFKMILDEPDRIDIPAAEVRANGLEEGMLLEVSASRLPDPDEER
jgi:hypothetical protein